MHRNDPRMPARSAVPNRWSLRRLFDVRRLDWQILLATLANIPPR